jgi:hypothetical protein
MKTKTARSALVTIVVLAATAGVVNSAPAGAPMTFQPHPDGFGGPLAPRLSFKPIDRVSGSGVSPLQRVPCAAPVAPGTACFVGPSVISAEGNPSPQ